MTALAALRDRLLALRADTIRRLADTDRPGAGFVQLLASVQGALAALDAEAAALDDAAKAERIVVVGGSDTIKLVSYVNSTTAACVTVSPQRAIAIALDLLDIAHRRWPA